MLGVAAPKNLNLLQYAYCRKFAYQIYKLRIDIHTLNQICTYSSTTPDPVKKYKPRTSLLHSGVCNISQLISEIHDPRERLLYLVAKGSEVLDVDQFQLLFSVLSILQAKSVAGCRQHPTLLVA